MLASTWPAVTTLPALTSSLSSLADELILSKYRSELCKASSWPTTLTDELMLPCRTATTSLYVTLEAVARVVLLLAGRR